SMSKLVKEWFETLRFWRFHTYEKKMEVLDKTLTIVGTLQQRVESNAITSEEAGILKARTFQELEKLTGIGATVPLRECATIDQKQLLTEMRNTKLLSSGQEPDESVEQNTIDWNKPDTA